MVKRWWWVVAAVVILVVGTYVFMGPRSDGSGGTSGAGTGSAASTVPPAPTKPARIAASGSELATITTAPPKQTVGQLKYRAGLAGQVYKVEFRLYGVGPVRDGRSTVTVATTSFAPRKIYSDVVRLPSPNLLLELGPGVSVTKGGAYSGTVTLTRRGDAIVFVLTSVKAE
jgi:hypothetical protein